MQHALLMRVLQGLGYLHADFGPIRQRYRLRYPLRALASHVDRLERDVAVQHRGAVRPVRGVPALDGLQCAARQAHSDVAHWL